MKKFIQNKLKEQKGLTLIELLAVIVIIAIIAAIAIPAIGNIIENSRYSAVKSDALNGLNAANLYYTDNPEAATGVTVSTLVSEGYIDNQGSLPDAGTFTSATPRAFTADAYSYSGSKNIKFTGATIEGINADTNKGSDEPPATGFVIGAGS